MRRYSGITRALLYDSAGNYVAFDKLSTDTVINDVPQEPETTNGTIHGQNAVDIQLHFFDFTPAKVAQLTAWMLDGTDVRAMLVGESHAYNLFKACESLAVYAEPANARDGVRKGFVQLSLIDANYQDLYVTQDIARTFGRNFDIWSRASYVLFPSADRVNASVFPSALKPTFTRASVATYVDPNGNLQTAVANELRFELVNGRWYVIIEPGATNQVRNNTMAGAVVGTPGALPTGWGINTRGLDRQVVAIGQENGVDYIDIRLFGTANSSLPIDVDFVTAVSAPALAGQTWTAGYYSKLIAAPTPPNEYRVKISERTAAGAYIREFNSVFTMTSTLTRRNLTATLIDANTAFVASAFHAGVTNGASYDFTIRIGLPQMELGAVATSVIKTSGTALTRAADVRVRTSATALIGQTAGTIYSEANIQSYAAATSRRLVDCYTSTNERISIAYDASLVLSAAVVSGGSLQAFIAMGSTPTGLYKNALAYALNDISYVVNGSSVGTDASATLPAMSNVGQGDGGAGGTQIGGFGLGILALWKTRLTNAELQTITS